MVRHTTSALSSAVLFLFLPVAAASASAPQARGPEPASGSQAGAGESGVAVGESTTAGDTGCLASSPPVTDTLTLRNRFLAFSAGDPDRLQAIRITCVALPPPFDVWNGAKLWAGQPSQVSENGACVGWPTCEGFPVFLAATLQCEPFYFPWSIWGILSVFHEGIVPEGSYRIEVIDETCPVDDESGYSEPLELTTARWGDTLGDCTVRPCTPPDGLINIGDVHGIIGRFVSNFHSIKKARAELEPGCPDLIINISDVMHAVGAFQGLSYPFEPTADDPCDSTCVNPLPQHTEASGQTP